MRISQGGLGIRLDGQFRSQQRRRANDPAPELQVGKRSKGVGQWGACVGALVWILLCAAPGVRAQGVRYDNVILGPRGGPVGAASIAVCLAGASTSTTPCSPLTTIYSDEALTQPIANPFQADSLGNYGFWAAPGHYIVEIYGTGVATRTMNVFLPCDPSNCSMSNATFSSITAGTLNLSGALTVNGRSVATEAKNTDAVLFVSPNGSDSHDGLSWGSAKQTLYAAVSAVENPTVGGGTIYVAANTACGGPVSGQGLWLIGDNDPAHTSPPSGWIYAEWPLRLVGVGTTTWYGNASESAVNLNCGSGTSGNLPGLWLSGTNRPLYFANLSFPLNYSSGLRLGIDTTGNRASSTGATSVVFDNVQFGAQINSVSGPAVDIGSNVFWVWFKHSTFNANSSATALSDQHQAVVINPGPSGNCGHQDGLIFLEHTIANGGGVHFYGSCENGGSLYVNDLATENQNDGSPGVWITTEPGNFADAYYKLNLVAVADSTVNPTYAVKVDTPSGTTLPPGAAVATVVTGAGGNGMNTSGPMTLLGGNTAGAPNRTVDPWLAGDLGFIGGRVYAQTDAGRRLFSPAAYPWPNIAPQIPTSWTLNNGGGTLTHSTVTGPDGATNSAIDMSIAGGTSQGGVDFSNSANVNSSAGDYYIAGAWYRKVTPAPSNYSGGNPLALGLQCGSGGSVSYLAGGGQYIHAPFNGNGEWEWGWSVAKVTQMGSGATACQLDFTGSDESGLEMQFFGPVILHVPAGAITDNEAAEIGANLGEYPDSLTPPVEATLRGLPFAFGGSGDNYFATLDHTALTANRTYDFPDASGTVALSLTGVTGSIGGSALAAGACVTGTASVANSTTSMAVVASPSADPGAGFTWEGWVSSAGTVTVRLCNVSGASATPSAETYNVRVLQ
jgi:hypothetical protein